MKTDKDPSKKVLKVPKSSRNTPSPRSYPLRSRSSSLLSSSPVKSPLKNSPKAPNIPSTSSDKCSICMSSDTLRSLNLKNAVSDFNSKIEDYNLISKSLQDNTASLNHAISAVKHFVISLDLEPDTLNNFVTNVTKDMEMLKCHVTDLSGNLTSISDNLSDLSNYVSKLDSLEEFVTKKLESIESESMKSNDILVRVSNLEELCKTLNTKLDNRMSDLPPITSSQDNSTSHTLTNIEELCRSLNY